MSGTTVPAAALQVRADGSAFVITEAGEVDVTVQGSGQGVVVVLGIEPGTRVQALVGGDGSTPAAPTPAPTSGAETKLGEDASADLAGG